MLDERLGHSQMTGDIVDLDRQANELIAEVRAAVRPRLFVVSGPSGVGKDTVIEHIRERLPDFHFVVTCTTRERRPGEIEGVHYVFLTIDEFRAGLDAGEFIEHAEVYGNLYGVPRAGIRSGLTSGRSTVVKVDVQGAATIRELTPHASLIYLMPPTMEVLSNRIWRRKTEDPDVIMQRIQTARNELQQVSEFDYMVVNEDLDQSVEQIMAIIAAEHLRVNQPECVL